MSRRGTHRTNLGRAARALLALGDGGSYQEVLDRLRSERQALGACARCGDLVVVGSDGTWHAIADRLAFCEEFLAHDDLDAHLGAFSPSHQVDEALVHAEDQLAEVHRVEEQDRCSRCTTVDVSSPPALVLFERLAEEVFGRLGGSWAALDDTARLRLLDAARRAWEYAEGPPSVRHGASRLALRRRFERDAAPEG